MIDILVVEEEPPINISKRLEKVYAALSKSGYPGLKVNKKTQV